MSFFSYLGHICVDVLIVLCINNRDFINEVDGESYVNRFFIHMRNFSSVL